MKFSPFLPVMTRSGHRVEILAILPPEKITERGEAIVALVHGSDERSIETYQADGRFDPVRFPSSWDLINVAVPVVDLKQYATMSARERAQYVAQTAKRIRDVVEG